MNFPPENIRQRLLAARLPSPPQTLLRLMALCQSDDASMAQLAELIARDPALTAKVLSVAHSAAYHRANAQTLTLLQASSTLGMALIKVLVISESVFQAVQAFRRAGAVDLRNFWKHSLSVAVLARTLAERQGDNAPEEAYLAGLLHDVGRLALLAAVPERYTDLFDLPDDPALCALEQLTLGISHAEAGAWLLEQWHLGGAMAQSLLHHHSDADTLQTIAPLTRTLQLAHRLAELPTDSRLEAPAWATEQDLSTDAITALVQQSALQVTRIARDLGVDISTPGATPVPAYTASRPQPLDTAQAELARDVVDRTILNEMAMTLINLPSTNAALTSLRQHASALLQLEDAIIMLARDNQQTLVPVSMNEQHLAATPLSFDVSFDPSIAQCMGQRKVVFARRGVGSPSPLLAVMNADEVVLLPLLTSQNCLGVLAGAVPAELSHHFLTQVPTLQAFGVYAGLALSRRRQADKNHTDQSVSAKEAQQLEHKRVAQAVNLLVDALAKADQGAPMVPVDLSLLVRDTMQQLLHRQLIPSNIEVNTELPNRAAWVQGSVGKIKQILLILIKNACESMPGGGQIVVNGGVLVQREGGVYAALTIADSGASLKEAIQAQLYEPVHTASRGDSDRLGFGLGTVNDLVDKMTGHLKFTASATGTRFDILLPCAKNPTV